MTDSQAAPHKPPTEGTQSPLLDAKLKPNLQYAEARQSVAKIWGWLPKPEWMRQLPNPSFPREPDKNFTLIPNSDKILADLKKAFNLSDEAIAEIEKDVKFLEDQFMDKFRKTDFEAAREQNTYRLYQIILLSLATITSLLGAFQAIALSNAENMLPIWAFAETFVALLTVLFTRTLGTRASLAAWLERRRMAEQLRREYFRYIAKLPPYRDATREYERRGLLTQRAAQIYNARFPDEPTGRSVQTSSDSATQPKDNPEVNS